MAVGGAWVDLSSVDSDNERDYHQLIPCIVTSARFELGLPASKQEEEGSNNRSVMSFRCSGLHARYNVRIKEIRASTG